MIFQVLSMEETIQCSLFPEGSYHQEAPFPDNPTMADPPSLLPSPWSHYMTPICVIVLKSFVRTLHYDPSILGGPTQHDS